MILRSEMSVWNWNCEKDCCVRERKCSFEKLS